jgi:hypothetical protein
VLRNCYKNIVRKTEEKRPLRRSRCKWEYYIKMNLKEMGGKLRTG